MIKKFIKFINENYKTGYFNFNDMAFTLSISIIDDLTDVKILYKEHIYEHLSIVVPDSKDLGNDEFFINPKIDKGMVNILIKEGFIECTNKKTIAGNKKSVSYKLV